MKYKIIVVSWIKSLFRLKNSKQTCWSSVLFNIIQCPFKYCHDFNYFLLNQINRKRVFILLQFIIILPLFVESNGRKCTETKCHIIVRSCIDVIDILYVYFIVTVLVRNGLLENIRSRTPNYNVAFVNTCKVWIAMQALDIEAEFGQTFVKKMCNRN